MITARSDSSALPLPPSLILKEDIASLKMASSPSGSVKGGKPGFNYVSNSSRRRRRDRLAAKDRSLSLPSPPSMATLSEHKSINSVDVTEETAALSADVSSEIAPDLRVSRVLFTPLANNPTASESALLLPQSTPPNVSASADGQTFPTPDSDSLVPKGLVISSSKETETSVGAHGTGEPSMPPSSLLPSRRHRSQSLWDESHKEGSVHQPQLSKTTRSSPKDAKSSERASKSKTKVSAHRQKPKLAKNKSAPSFSSTKQTNVADDALMDRALAIRQNLMNFEMQELAAEAERAAESGLEKFVGSTSKFGVDIQTPQHQPNFVDDSEFVLKDEQGFATPSRRKSFVDAGFLNRMEYTPSYFARKKIPVTSLRNFSEIVPDFKDMHSNIRIHLGNEGVDTDVLPKVHTRHNTRSLIKNDTDDTEKEEGEVDAKSEAPSNTGSVSSFSSYAVASLASLREIIEFVKRPNKSGVDDNIVHNASTLSNFSNTSGMHIDDSKSTKGASHESSGSAAVGAVAARNKSTDAPLPPSASLFKPAMPAVDSDSDDSSVEFYGRKSPIESIQSAPSREPLDVVEASRMRASLSQSSRSQIKSTDKRKGGGSVSFRTEQANYKSLLDKLHQKHPASPSVSFEAIEDGASCGASLTNIDLDLLPSPTATSSNKSTPMASFLSKIGFSRSMSTDGRHKSKIEGEDNKHFVANFFYNASDKPSDILDGHGGVSTLKFDANPELDRGNEPFCLPAGCGSAGTILPACDSAVKAVDFVFDWFNIEGGDKQMTNPNPIIDPKAMDKSLQPWIKARSALEAQNNDTFKQRYFAPPKLSIKLAASHHEDDDNDIFCSPDSVKLGKECEDAMACPEFQDQMGCSPE